MEGQGLKANTFQRQLERDSDCGMRMSDIVGTRIVIRMQRLRAMTTTAGTRAPAEVG